MQAGEIIWFLAGIGAGLTLAIVIFAAVAVADARRARRQLGAASGWASVDAAAGEHERPRAQMPERQPVAPSGPLANVPPERVARSRPRPISSERRNLASSAVVEDEMMSTLAAEISRMHSSETVTVDLAPARPVQTVQMSPEPVRFAEPMPQPAEQAPARTERPAAAPPEALSAEPVVAATVALDAAPASAAAPAVEAAPPPVEVEAAPVTEEPPRPAKPVSKLPPLPRVAPARKFAPALPPRHPPASGAKT